MGKPVFSVDTMDVGPDDLPAQLPLRCEPVRTVPGSDRPDYVIAVAQQAVHHRTSLEKLHAAGVDPAAADPDLIRIHEDGTVDLRVFGLVLATRLVGQQFRPGMRDVAAGLAYVVDNTVLRDERLDLRKTLYAAVVTVSDATGA